MAVTGAGSGIGAAVARRLRGEGWSVVAADADEAGLAALGAGDALVPVTADVASEAGNAAIVAAAHDRFGRLDGLVLNAGVAGVGAIDEQPLDEFDRILSVNLRGVVLGVRAALGLLRQADDAAIVVTASVSGLFGDPGLFAYNASKGGVVNFVRAAALDLGPERIRVNAVCPGGIRGTGMTGPMERYRPELYQEMEANTPLGRFGDPAEVAGAVSFLLSEDASFVTGVALPVDGGVTAGTGQFRGPRPTSV